MSASLLGDAASAVHLSESVAVAEHEIQWRNPELVQPMAWSQGLFSDLATGMLTTEHKTPHFRLAPCLLINVLSLSATWPSGLAYQFLPCCCGTPQAVRKVNRHLAKYGLHPTQHALCPCCTLCQPEQVNEFGKTDKVMGEIASGSWWCFVFCPPCYIQSNRGMFEEKHFLPGK